MYITQFLIKKIHLYIYIYIHTPITNKILFVILGIFLFICFIKYFNTLQCCFKILHRVL